MTLAAGTRLGPYEILSPLGAGGMGEVYRARDPRLGREVAVKVLPAGFSADPDRMRRFEQEARAASALNHPNIMSIFDVGEDARSPYVVSELLEGETLRERFAGGPLPARKVIDLASQIALGLAAAHEKGIVHRDLKPENLFVTKDGRVKILDFGLAKLTQPEAQRGPLAEAPTQDAGTAPGAVLGTVGYMSPEQVRGQPADQRSDLFAFGAVLYEMLSGRRAFRGASPVETMNAILKEEPPEMSVAGEVLSPALEGIVRHCLEKSPEERFQSARDLAFALGSAGVWSGTVAVAGPARAARRPRTAALLVAMLVAAALAGGAFVFGRRTAPVSSPSFEPLTFRYGTVLSARFAPDGQTVAYGASWEGKPAEVFTQRPGSPEARSLGLSGADLLAISASGEMALSLHNHRIDVFRSAGTLGQAPLSGGAPREILKDVFYADWSPDGKSLAVVRLVQGRSRLEFPIGKTLYETAGWISHPRFSPKGDAIAFLDHSEQGTDFGSVAVVDLAGHRKKFTPEWGSVEGLAWSASGEEIWFTASETFYRALRAVDLAGRTRLIARTPGNLTLLDVSRAGRALVNRENWRGILVASAAGGPERDLSWLDTTVVTDISADGRTLLFGEMGEAGGASSAAYLRPTDGSPAVRLGDGIPTALSPDGSRVLTILHGATSRLLMLPTGAGQAGEIVRGPIIEYHWATFFPDGMRLLFAGNEAGHGARLYVQNLSGGSPRAVSGEGIGVLLGGIAIAPDGSQAAAVGPDERVWLYSLDKGGDGRPLPGLAVGYIPVRWAADGRSLFVFRPRELPARVLRVSSEDGRAELWKSLMPSDPAGVTLITPLVITPDGRSYAYTFARSLSDLYLVDGLK